jgi:hypothetical protein
MGKEIPKKIKIKTFDRINRIQKHKTNPETGLKEWKG